MAGGEVVQAERVEPAVDVAVVAAAEQRSVSLDLAADGGREQQRVRVLRDVRGTGAVGDVRPCPPSGSSRPAERAQQRGLARAVAAEQRDDVAARGRRGRRPWSTARPPSSTRTPCAASSTSPGAAAAAGVGRGGEIDR